MGKDVTATLEPLLISFRFSVSNLVIPYYSIDYLYSTLNLTCIMIYDSRGGLRIFIQNGAFKIEINVEAVRGLFTILGL
jgi:hypothetical protein